MDNTVVSIVEKKEFIRWFLKEHQMKRRECVWILNYLISHESLLKNVHFVEDAHYCPRAMIMSSIKDAGGIPFRFYKGSIMTADAEKSFHDLRLNPDEDIFIQLNFPDAYQSQQYLAVLEENKHVNLKEVNDVDDNLIDSILKQSINSFQVKKLQDQIDEALDNKDKDKFLELTSLLKEFV